MFNTPSLNFEAGHLLSGSSGLECSQSHYYAGAVRGPTQPNHAHATAILVAVYHGKHVNLTSRSAVTLMPLLIQYTLKVL